VWAWLIVKTDLKKWDGSAWDGLIWLRNASVLMCLKFLKKLKPNYILNKNFGA
jgi:hypothetical protein